MPWLHISISRCGICAAWSFNALEETCTLHTTDACCGQLDKRRANSDFVSGYICPQCSSTRNDCPCPRRIRQLGTLGCHIAQSAGKSPRYTSQAVSLTKIPNWKGDVHLAHPWSLLGFPISIFSQTLHGHSPWEHDVHNCPKSFILTVVNP